MKKKATARPAKASSRQSTLNFAASPEAEKIVEATCVAPPATPSVPAERDSIPPAKKRNAAALGNESPNTSSSEVAKEGGWRMVALQEVGRIVTASTPPKARKDFYGGSFPFVKPGELLHCMVSESVDHLSDAGSEVADVAPAGGVLVSCIGNLGKTGLAARPVAFNQQINAIIPHVPDHSKWIFYAVQTPDFASQISAVSSATTIAIVNKGKFSTLRIPLAPLPEQRRIVAEIEKQFTRLDAGVAALKRVQANLKRYRAAVLKAACEGKLVPTEAELANRGGTNFQSGAELLAAISDLEANDVNPRRAGRLWGAGHVPDLTDEERLSLPDGWVWAKVRELGFDPENAVQVGPMSMKSSDFADAGTPVLNVGCVQWGRFVESKLDHLPAEKALEFERYRIKCGDVLFTRSGTVGRCAVAQPHQDGWLMTFHLLRARANPQKCLPPFLRIMFEGAPHIRRQTKEASVGSTRAGFNTNLLGNLAIPLPPLAEQTRIVAEVERRLSVVDELEAVVSANLQRANRLRQSILQKAFTGELV